MKNKELIPVVIKSKNQKVIESIGFLLLADDYSFSYDGDKCKFTLEITDYMNLLTYFRQYGFDDFPEVIVNGVPVNEFGEELQ